MRHTNVWLMAVAAGPWLSAWAVAEEQRPLKEVFEQLLPGMGADQNYQGPQQQWQEICFRAGAPGNEAMREEAARLMAGALVPGTPPRARAWLLGQLERIGRAEGVEAAASQLADPDPLVRDAARRALAAIPAPEAGAKLTGALAAAKDNASKLGLIAALAYRAEPGAVPALAGELGSADQAVAAAAAQALGRIATPEAARALAPARTRARGEQRLQLNDACLRCAERMLREGRTAEAAAIYKELAGADEPRSTRVAAQKGLLSATGKK